MDLPKRHRAAAVAAASGPEADEELGWFVFGIAEIRGIYDFVSEFLQQCSRLLTNAPQGGVKKLYRANGHEKVHNLIEVLKVSFGLG